MPFNINYKKYQTGGSSVGTTTTIVPLQQNVILHTPGTGGLNYQARRTNLTGDISNRSIKENTPIPSSFKDIDFLNNYAEFKKSFSNVPEDYSPTSVPTEGNKHWNIKRFVIDPHLTNTMSDLGVKGSTQEQLKANILSDMYEYYLLQNQGNRNKSFRQAKRFLRKNINPVLNGPFLDQYMNADPGTVPNFGMMDPLNTFADENPIKTLESYNKAFRESEGMKLYRPNYNPDIWNRERLKDVTMDYLKNFRNMSNRDAKKLWRKWEDETKDQVNVRVGPSQSLPSYDISSEAAWYNSPIFQNPEIFAKPRTNQKILSQANRMVEWIGEDNLPHRRLFSTMGDADNFMKYLTNEKKSFGTTISNRGILEESDRREFEIGGSVATTTTRAPIYTDDPRRVRAYNDSSYLYNRFKDAKSNYINFISSQGFNPSYVEEWTTDGWVDNNIHPKIGAIKYGILKTSGGGYDRDSKGNPKDFNYYPTKSGKNQKVYSNTDLGKVIGIRYPIYKKPVQPYILEKKLPELKMVPAVPINKVDPFKKEIKITNPPKITQNGGNYVLRFGEYDSEGNYTPREVFFKTRKEADDMMNFLLKENDKRYETGRYYNNLSTQGNYQLPPYKQGGQLQKFKSGGSVATTTTIAPFNDDYYDKMRLDRNRTYPLSGGSTLKFDKDKGYWYGEMPPVTITGNKNYSDFYNFAKTNQQNPFFGTPYNRLSQPSWKQVSSFSVSGGQPTSSNTSTYYGQPASNFNNWNMRNNVPEWTTSTQFPKKVPLNINFEDVVRRGDLETQTGTGREPLWNNFVGSQYVKNQAARNAAGYITASQPRSNLDWFFDMVSHPMEALGRSIHGQSQPTYYSGNNPYDMVFGFPGSVLESGKNLVKAALSPIETGKTIVAGGTNLLTNTLFDENLFDESYNNKAIGLGLDLLNFAGGRMIKKDFLRLYDRNFNKVGRQLANIERKGLEQGLDPSMIRLNQLIKTGTSPDMRNPIASFYRDITPQSIINKVKASKYPLVNTIPNLFTDPVSSGIRNRYASALGWSAANQTGKFVNKVHPKLYKDLAYKVMSTSSGAQRKTREVLNAIFRNRDVGNYTGVIGGDDLAAGFGLRGRNLLKNYIYGNAQGFDLSDIKQVGLDDYIKQYGDLKTYKLLTKDYSNNNPFTNVDEVTNDFLSKKSFTDYFKQSYPKLYDDLVKINPNFADDKEMLQIWNTSVEPSTTEAIIKNYLSKNKYLKVGRETEGVANIYDNIAGHQIIYSLDPQTNQIMKQTQDLWKFTGNKYGKRWSSGAHRDPQLVTANDRLNELKTTSQAELVERSGKPFILQDKRPVSFSSYSNPSPGNYSTYKPPGVSVKLRDLIGDFDIDKFKTPTTLEFKDFPLDLKSISSRASKLRNKEKGGLIRRADGSYSRRGLWDNIRANKGSGKKPTKQMLEQEAKIKKEQR